MNWAPLKENVNLKKLGIFSIFTTNFIINFFLEKRFDDIEKSISNINKIKSKLKWSPKVDFNYGLNLMRNEDKERLLKMKIPSLKLQKKIIKNFNRISN
jgi:hypothetical protein